MDQDIPKQFRCSWRWFRAQPKPFQAKVGTCVTAIQTISASWLNLAVNTDNFSMSFSWVIPNSNIHSIWSETHLVGRNLVLPKGTFREEQNRPHRCERVVLHDLPAQHPPLLLPCFKIPISFPEIPISFPNLSISCPKIHIYMLSPLLPCECWPKLTKSIFMCFVSNFLGKKL